MVMVAMLVTAKHPTMKTSRKVTMSMKTTITIVPHRVLRIVWSRIPFSNAQLVYVQGARQRSGVHPFFICYSVKFFHVGYCVYLPRRRRFFHTSRTNTIPARDNLWDSALSST